MRNQRIIGLAAVVLALAACGGGDDGGEATDQTAEAAAVEGDIVVLTQRTDIVDTVFVDYKTAFEAKYPDVTVEFEAITDYEGEVRTRMNTDEYGDVLLIPNSISADELPQFFEPLGTVEELGKTYRFVTEQAYEDEVYGLAITGNAQGFVYNKAVWEAAGITEPPTTPQEFLDALQAIADKTEAIPLYTNYADGWPLTQWEGMRGAVSGNPEAVNELTTLDQPWAEGEEHFTIDSLLFDAVAAGLTEEDPTTTDWESSKGLLGTGQIATMALGSWSIVQMQEQADDPADIGYLPFPNAVDGQLYTVIGGDYKNAINVNSEHKAAARAWIDWFANESGYALDQGGISPVITDPSPDTLADFDANNVEFIELTPPPTEQAGLVTRIDDAAQIGLFDPQYRQRLVDAARGSTDETKQAIFDDLNAKWAAARADTT